MKISTLLLLLLWCTRVYCNHNSNTWFDIEDYKQIEKGLRREESQEEQEQRKRAKRYSQAFVKQNEYLLDGVRNSNIGGVFKLGKEPEHDHRPRRPALIHATLTKEFTEKHRDKDKSDLSWDQMADVCDVWLYRINFLVEEVACFPSVGTGILLTVKNDREGDDVWKFLVTRTEIAELTWNEKTEYPYKRDE